MNETKQVEKGGGLHDAKVYGDRICLHCKGICHEDSIREKFGKRKSYWCSESCLKAWLKNKYGELPEEKLENIVEESLYEKVDVITK